MRRCCICCLGGAGQGCRAPSGSQQGRAGSTLGQAAPYLRCCWPAAAGHLLGGHLLFCHLPPARCGGGRGRRCTPATLASLPAHPVLPSALHLPRFRSALRRARRTLSMTTAKRRLRARARRRRLPAARRWRRRWRRRRAACRCALVVQVVVVRFVCVRENTWWAGWVAAGARWTALLRAAGPHLAAPSCALLLAINRRSCSRSWMPRPSMHGRPVRRRPGGRQQPWLRPGGLVPGAAAGLPGGAKQQLIGCM